MAKNDRILLDGIVEEPASAVRLRSKFMRTSEAYEKVFAESAPLDVWPMIANILKRTDAGLESIRSKAKETDRFLKTWRQIVSFLLVARSRGTFFFGSTDLIGFDLVEITKESVSEIWRILHVYAAQEGLTLGWQARANVIAACKFFARDYAISGIESIAAKPSTRDVIYKKNVTPPTPEFIERVKALLPPQPWKPGLHRKVASDLGCSASTYFSAVGVLIRDGHFYRQQDGVLYGKDGAIVGFDPTRVDPITMRLREAEG